ncbi:hypothetical protein [Streptomyces sp. NPDC052114]|uniref:hypothetical protein n=1 Tax=unclassified Streptomyces TaxID=2593676 RepID=UPI00342633AE
MTTSFQTPPPPTFAEQQDARERNDSAYRSTVTFKELPDSGHVAHRATPTDVQVTATDIDVLAEWLYVTGGRVTTVDLPSGQTVWTLHTSTWSDSPTFPVVPVHVSVVLAVDEPVMQEIRDAVVPWQYVVAIQTDERLWIRFNDRDRAVSCAASYGLGPEYVRTVLGGEA